MSDLSAYSESIPFLEAKKLLASMQKPGKGGLWTDWSGEGGADLEFKEENVPIDRLSSYRLPEYCPCLRIIAKEIERSKSEMLNAEVMGGDDWLPPECGGGESDIRFWIVDPVLNWPVFIALSKRSGWRHLGRSFNESAGIWVYVSGAEGEHPLGSSPRMTYDSPPDVDAILSFYKRLTEVYSLPDENSKGLLETRVHLSTASEPVFEHQFEIGMFDELRDLVHRMIAKMIRDSMSDFYSVSACSGIGGAAWFEGEMHNVRDVSMQFLNQVAHRNNFPFYDITYHSLGPRSWKDREKSRKKWKKLIREQVGTLTLENGAVAEVSLVIEKEGYVFSLNFGSDEDVIKFFQSKLFQKTKWHSGAE